MKKVQSNNRPAPVRLLKGKQLLAINIEEVTRIDEMSGDETTEYRWDEVNTEVGSDVVDALVSAGASADEVKAAATKVEEDYHKSKWDRSKHAEYTGYKFAWLDSHPTEREMTTDEKQAQLDGALTVTITDPETGEETVSPDTEYKAAKADEYTNSYPSERVMTNEEKVANDTDIDGEVIARGYGYKYPMVPIVYEGGILTMDEWVTANMQYGMIPVAYDETMMSMTEFISSTDNSYVPEDVVTVQAKVDKYLEPTMVKIAKSKRDHELATLKIEANTVLYDANGKALGNMSSVVAIANWKYNQAIANGATVADAYTAIFKDTIINWRGADNAVHQVQVESVCEALEASMHQIAVVIGVE